MKKVYWKSRSDVKNKSFSINKNQDLGRRDRPEENTNQGKGVQCHECEDFGHIRSECLTYLINKKKGLSVSWSEKDSESDPEEEASKQVTSLTGICDSDDGSDYEEISFKELAASYKDLCLGS